MAGLGWRNWRCFHEGECSPGAEHRRYRHRTRDVHRCGGDEPRLARFGRPHGRAKANGGGVAGPHNSERGCSQQRDPALLDPTIYLDRIEADELADLQERNTSLGNQSTHEPIRDAQPLGKPVDVDEMAAVTDQRVT